MRLNIALILLLASQIAWAVDAHNRSQANSSTAVLSGGETFTGKWELVDDPDVIVIWKTDVTGTVFFDFSPDGVNPDSTFPVNGFKVQANISAFHKATKAARFFRVRLVNGSDPQTFLRLQTLYGDFDQGNLPVNATIGGDTDAIVVRAVNSETDMALGRFAGFEVGAKFGRNPDVDTASTPEDVWVNGGFYTGQPESFTPETVTVVSSSANDTSAGTGAQTLAFYGLKTSTSTAYETETVTLNGTSSVTSVNSWWRINRAKVMTAGSTGSNAGTITIASSTTTANVFIAMTPLLNQTTVGAYTVPAEHDILIKRLRASITRATGAAGSGLITFRIREPGTVYHSTRAFDIQTGDAVNYTEFGGEVYPAGTDIKFTIDEVSDNNTIADAAFEYVLVAE